jgi:dihydroorotate dehydrogenase electron transfer subunit
MYQILSNEQLTKDVFKMVMQGDTAAISAPGQFINIKLDGLFLRRPISICDYDENTITVIYKVVGEGTELMSTLTTGAEIDCLVGLGNGYDITKSQKPHLIGGGVRGGHVS